MALRSRRAEWAMQEHRRVVSPAKAERLRRKVEQARREKRKFVAQICGIGILMVLAVVADYLFIQWGRYVRHRQQYHRQGVTNSVAGTNGAAPRSSVKAGASLANAQVVVYHRRNPLGHLARGQ